MIKLTLSQAAAAMDADLRNGQPQTVFEGVVTDSRKVRPGMLYVPIAGARVDGHDFARSAIEQGAAAALWSRDHTPYPDDFPILLIDEPVAAMGALAHAWLEQLGCQVTGVTGSNGKTSAKDLCASVFSQKYRTYQTQGNHNNEIGLPLTIFETDAGTEMLVLEMGMENAGEIAQLCEIAPPDLAIITSIGSAHLENLGSIENIARAKAEIIGGLKENGTLVWNAENPYLAAIVAGHDFGSRQKSVPYGKGTDFEPQQLHLSRQGLTFLLPAISDQPFSVSAAASVQAENATAAILAGLERGLDIEQCRNGAAQAVLTPMRGQIIPWKQALLIDDTYKSNPEAAESALRTLMEIPASMHVAVLGDMLDLGEEEQKLHEQIGVLAAGLGVDALYAYGKRSAHTASAFGKGGSVWDDKQALVQALRRYENTDTAVLVKGSRAMEMDTVVRELIRSE